MTANMTNILYRLPSQKGTKVATILGSTCYLNQFCDFIVESEGLDREDFLVANGTKVFRPTSSSIRDFSLQNNSLIDILIPLLGGKGGFGSLLRAIGAQIEKTTNRDACRDLSGRRIRDIKRDEELRKLLALQDKLKEEAKKRKKEKLMKLRKTVEETKRSASIQELVRMFDDHDYGQRRIRLSEIIEAAVEKGVINSESRQTRCQDEPKKANSKGTKDLWLGLEDSDEDLSSDDEVRDAVTSSNPIL